MADPTAEMHTSDQEAGEYIVIVEDACKYETLRADQSSTTTFHYEVRKHSLELRVKKATNTKMIGNDIADHLDYRHFPQMYYTLQDHCSW